MSEPRTLFEKIWSDHVVRDLGDNSYLVHIDRHLLHEVSGAVSFKGLRESGQSVRRPDLTIAVLDHLLDTMPGRSDETQIPRGTEFIRALRAGCEEFGVRLIDIGDMRQGIVHVIAPELGFALPGATIVCGDSHTCSLGGIGAYAFGIGSTDGQVVLSTQTLVQTKPKAMRVSFEGPLRPGVYPKDMILHLIRLVTADGGNEHVIEFAGSAIRAMSVEGRLTICNMSVELSARGGIVAPDDVTFDYLAGRPLAPAAAAWHEAVRYWRSLRTDDGAVFDKEVRIDCADIAPLMSWGTSPEHVLRFDERVPDPADAPDARTAAGWTRALNYMGLEPGMALEGLPITGAFIGSCTNGRLSDLEAAAEYLKGRHVAPGVRAICTPGSMAVKAEAEAKGIATIFKEAGFEWREPGCSLCMSGGAGGETFAPGSRIISSTNRNFESRQGKGVRSHLASPAAVALAAVEGRLADLERCGWEGADRC